MLLLVLVCAAPASAGRIQGLPSYVPSFDNGPGNMLAGEAFVYATPRRVYGWPAAGGLGGKLARVPKLLRPADSEFIFGSGFVRVAAAQPGLIALIRDRGPAFFPKFEPRYGKQLIPVRVVCPRGCRLDVKGRVKVDGLPLPLGSSYHPARSTTIDVEPDLDDFEAGQVVRLRVISYEPTLGRLTRRFVVRVR